MTSAAIPFGGTTSISRRCSGRPSWRLERRAASTWKSCTAPSRRACSPSCWRAKLQSYAAAAFEAGNVAAAISAERGVVDNLTLLSKLLGMLVVRHEVKHSLLVSADYLTLRDTLLRVLRKHPAAAKDVAEALHELEARAAEAIKAKASGKAPPLVIEHQTEAAP
jgi:PHD/YefM family antitoxin component YafN of YafNO toxin-antitoxin module